MPHAAGAAGELREIGVPRADAGMQGALRSIYSPCHDLPSEFAILLDRLR